MVAVVTGGSRGIGKSIAEELLKKILVLSSRQEIKVPKLKNLKKLMRIRSFIPADISVPNDRKGSRILQKVNSANLTCL